MVLFRLITSALFPVLFAIVFYLLEKRTKFKNLPSLLRQIIIGVSFGGIACLATQFGIYYDGFVMNVRGAAPLTAGLLFGGPAGLIAGVMGGLYRWFSVYWGIGAYTRTACSMATILAGFIGAICRRFMFDNKKASWLYGLFFSVTTEVLHMLLVFLTHMNDISTAFVAVKVCAAPMIMANGLSVMLSLLIVSLAGKERIRIKGQKRPISQTFSVSLFACVLIAYVVTSAFTYNLQSKICRTDVENLLSMTINDVEADVMDASDENLLKLTRQIADDIDTNGMDVQINSVSSEAERDIVRSTLNLLLSEYNVTEINIIDKNGTILVSTNKMFDFYYMGAISDGQAAEFLCLLNGETEYVQQYQPVDYDPTISRKYAGVSLPNGGFVQVGYDSERFQDSIRENLTQVARNRHIDESGFVFILNEATMDVVSAPESTVTMENVAKFTSLIDSEKDKSVLSFTGQQGEQFYCMYDHVEGYIVVGCIPVDEAIFSRDISIYIGIFMQVVVFSTLFVLVYFLIKRIIVDNIHKINDSLAQITSGDLNTVVNVRGNEEFASLSDDINSTVSKLKDYIAEASARIDKELEFARNIQLSALPSVFPPYPNRTEFDIYAYMATAKEVGGDFYDFYLIGEDTLVLLIADVSGKGIPAAMFMMTSKTMIKSYVESGKNVADAFTHANKKLCETNDAGMFVTAWMGFLNTKTGVIKFVNAGHNPPAVKHADGSFEFLKMRAGFVLAGMEEVNYRENELMLAPGDEIFLYTDGVTEATNKDNQLYGDDRLLHILNDTPYQTAERLCNAVLNDVDDFVKDAPQFDDITILSLKYSGKTD